MTYSAEKIAVQVANEEMSYEELHDFMVCDELTKCEHSENHKRIIDALRKRDAGEFEWHY